MLPNTPFATVFEGDPTAAERDAWRARYRDLRVSHELSEAATAAGATDPAQITRWLARDARLAEIPDSPGEYAVRVRVATESRTSGKPMTLDLSPVEAVATLRESPENANLFLPPESLGAGPTAPSTEEYMARRRQQRAAGR